MQAYIIDTGVNIEHEGAVIDNQPINGQILRAALFGASRRLPVTMTRTAMATALMSLPRLPAKHLVLPRRCFYHCQ